MKNKITYVLMAGLAMSMLSSAAMADDCKYFKVISAQSALPQLNDVVPAERVLTFPIVVERTSTMSAVIAGKTTPVLVEETTALPAMLERTTVVKPHHWPLSFGVWHNY
jgi:hypothetical protein